MRIFLLLLLFPFFAMAGTTPIDVWLVQEPAPQRIPVFGDSGDAGTLFDATDMNIVTLRPEVGDTPCRTTHGWAKQKTKTVRMKSPGGAYSFMAASYLRSPAWRKGTLAIHSNVPVQVYLNGKKLGQSLSAEKGKYVVSEKTTLPRGKHALLIRLLATDGKDATFSGEWNGDPVTFTDNADYSFANFADFTLFDDVSSPACSPHDLYIAYIRSSYNHTTKKESWLEVLDSKTGATILSLPPAKGLGHVGWMNGQVTKLFYTMEGKDGSDIWMMDFPDPLPSRVKQDVKGLVKLAAGASPYTLYYTADEAAEESENDWTLLDELEDRMEDWTPRRALFELNQLTRETRRITAIGDSFALDDFSVNPDGAQILFTRRIPQLGRPYYRTEFWLYDTEQGTARKVLTQLLPFETRPLSLTWIDSVHAAYVTAAYETLPDDTLDRNSTQTAVWLLNTMTGESKPLNPGVNYSVDEDEDRGALRWCSRLQRLYMRVTRGCEVRLMRMDPLAISPQAEPLAHSRAVVGDFDVNSAGQCVMIASDPLHPNALITYDPATGAEQRLRDGNIVLMARGEWPSWERWDFASSHGDTIEGFLYYPPEYKPELSRSWPLIVYFYGGVSPRDLSWRYTYHWWCANGYVVYVLNPSGCVGYGPEFADKHSNDWGTLASRDIIEGTQKLLQEKPFLDKDHVGAYGGSYGGFLTLDLATKTDCFAALASLSGISNIASYFGGGTWGFTYGDIALPRSFPWNRRDMFVDKSPVFHADQVKTPLLLSHGAADVNVPVGESDQMFTALKLLGKDVAYVQFAGEDHIFTKFENRVAEMEILREWFDKYLKNEPEGWDARWRK